MNPTQLLFTLLGEFREFKQAYHRDQAAMRKRLDAVERRPAPNRTERILAALAGPALVVFFAWWTGSKEFALEVAKTLLAR
jgi:hypothetical protein